MLWGKQFLVLFFRILDHMCILHFDKIKLEGGSLLIGIFINSNQGGGWVMILYIGGEGALMPPFKRLQRQKNAL